MANDSKRMEAENKVTNGAKATLVQAEPTEEKGKTDCKTNPAARTYVISAEEMEEFKMMKAVLATRQGKALFLDYLEGDIGRYVYLGWTNTPLTHTMLKGMWT